MFDLDKWQEIFATISKHRLRTFLTALGVFWGIFMLVLLRGAGKGLENGVLGLFGNIAKNSMFVGTRKTSKPYEGLRPGRYHQLMMSDMEALQNNFPDEIQYLSPQMWMPSGEVRRGNKKGAYDMRGDSPERFKINPMTVTAGRFINKFDMDEKRKIVVIGRRVREVLFDKEEKVIGEFVKFRGVDFKVVGVFKSDRRGQENSEDEQQLYLPLTTVQQMQNRPNQVSMFSCSMYPTVSATKLEPKIIALLKKRHRVAPNDEQAFWTNNMEEEFGEVMGLFNGIAFIVWFVGIGSLMAGVIGVGNIMLILVKERTKEIGIRKALGATPRSIISMILLESIFITTIAGYLGLIFSTAIIIGMDKAIGDGGDGYYAHPEVDIHVGIIALIILIISGALTGLIPAMLTRQV